MRLDNHRLSVAVLIARNGAAFCEAWHPYKPCPCDMCVCSENRYRTPKLGWHAEKRRRPTLFLKPCSELRKGHPVPDSPGEDIHLVTQISKYLIVMPSWCPGTPLGRFSLNGSQKASPVSLPGCEKSIFTLLRQAHRFIMWIGELATVVTEQDFWNSTFQLQPFNTRTTSSPHDL